MAAHAAGRGRSRPSESRPPRGTGGRHPSRRGRVRGLEAGPGVAEEEQVAAVELPEPLEVAVRQLAVHPGHDRGRHRLAAASVCGAAGAPGAPCQRGRSNTRGGGSARPRPGEVDVGAYVVQDVGGVFLRRGSGARSAARLRATRTSAAARLEILVPADEVVAHGAREAEVGHGPPVLVVDVGAGQNHQVRELLEGDVVDRGAGRHRRLVSAETSHDLPSVRAAKALAVYVDFLKLAPVRRDEALQRVAHKHELCVSLQSTPDL